MDTATLERTNVEDVLRFIDEWLDDNAWKCESWVIDFALDVRSLVEETAPEE
jgi:hypothetical protein